MPEDRYRGDEPRRERTYGRDAGREVRNYGPDDRGFIERAGDEVRSWFGDDEAERRRRMDEARYGRDSERYGRDWDRYGSENRSGRDWSRYGRDWDYGHSVMGYEAGRGGYEPGRGSYRGVDRWGNERSFGDRPNRDYDYGQGLSSSRYGSADDYSTRRLEGRARGPFFGRGPRGYQRSDDRIREDVCDRLCDDPWIDASDVEVIVRSGEVTLTGMVRDRTDKRRIEDVVEDITGVREVHNNVRVSQGWEGASIRESQQQGTTTANTSTGSSSTSRR